VKNFPNNIPKSPSRFYSKSWIGWGDFLDTGLKRGQNYTKIFKNKSKTN